MPPISIPLIHRTNAALLKSHPVVAVFVGATSGIGSFSILSLARTHGTTGAGLRIYSIGRNAAAAEKIFADCKEVCPSGQFVFVQTDDLTLLRNVDLVCEEVMRLERQEVGKTGEVPRADFLVMCQGIVHFNGRKDTPEGIDTIMSLLYYSRMRFTIQLFPLLLSSTLPTGAHVISVLGPGNAKAGRESKVWPEDLSLRNPKNYGFIALGNQIAYMKTFFFEYLAKKYPGKLSLMHYFPGLVWTDAFGSKDLPLWFRATITIAKPLLNRSSTVVGREETGERVVFLMSRRFPARSAEGKDRAVEKGSEVGVAMASDGVLGGGAYRVQFTMEEIPTVPDYERHRREGLPEKCVQHTLKAFEEIEAGRVFKD